MAKKLDITKLAGRLAEINASQGGNNSGGATFVTIKDGRNVVRILPPFGEMDSFAVEAWVHYGIGKSDTDKKGKMVVCPKTANENNPCPACELSKQLYSLSKKKDDKAMKEAKQFNKKKRVYYNAIDKADVLEDFELREDPQDKDKQIWFNKKTDEQESPIKVLGTGIGVYKDLIKIIIDPEYGDITDPEEGLDIIITKSGSGQFNTEYEVKSVRKESAIEFADWEEHLNDLSVFTKFKSYDDIATMMDGGTVEEDEASDEDIDNATANLPEKKVDTSDDAEDDGDMQSEIQKALEARKNRNK